MSDFSEMTPLEMPNCTEEAWEEWLDKQEVMTSDNMVLALRPHEGYTIYEQEAPGRYAIALVETPAFPGDSHEICMRVATIAAYRFHTLVDDKTAWGWVHLMSGTKRILGAALVDMGAEVGRWYFVEMGDRDD